MYWKISLLLLINFIFHSTFSRVAHSQSDTLRVLFYNVENLFDPFDDSLTNDNEFTYEGERHWTYGKFQEKLSHIYKVFLAVGNPYPPAIIGLCEIENRFVLNQLVYKTPFSKFDYRIVHEDSPDKRGIDVALLFDPSRFKLIQHHTIHIQFPFDPKSRTRDILYVKGLVYDLDTVHLFVNHWPSRWGGQLATDPKRKYVADILKKNADSLFLAIKNPNIIIMGDFNDYPDNESISKHLQARTLADSSSLVNLMTSFNHKKNIGSHKFHQNWGTLDQFIVSNFLLLPEGSLKIAYNQAFIFNADFLLTSDEKYLGKKPYRTFLGYRYIGGYSDHLPIFFDMFK